MRSVTPREHYGRRKDSPIPITGPYFSFSWSALTATGHKRRSARQARKKRDSEDAKRRDCDLVGRRDSRVMMRGERKKGRCWMKESEREFVLIRPRAHKRTRHVSRTPETVSAFGSPGVSGGFHVFLPRLPGRRPCSASDSHCMAMFCMT